MVHYGQSASCRCVLPAANIRDDLPFLRFIRSLLKHLRDSLGQLPPFHDMPLPKMNLQFPDFIILQPLCNAAA